MRSLQKNKRTIYYANLIGEEPILDDYGNETSEVKSLYEKPTRLEVNYSSNVGEEMVNVFGSATNYSRAISLVGSDCPLKVKCLVWINSDTSKKANYEVVKVADSLNSFLIALNEVV